MNYLKVYLFLIILPSIAIGKGNEAELKNPVFCFYYNWYGNEKWNGKEIHWAHGIIPESKSSGPEVLLPGRDNIASNYFPELGNYSNSDPKIVAKHMKMMANSNIDVVAVTWWRNDELGQKCIPLIMKEAEKAGLKVCFHIEPYPGRTAFTVGQDIKNIINAYSQYPAFFRQKGKPYFFIYDSYLIPQEEWSSLLSPEGKTTIRLTPFDAVMIGLWVKEDDGGFFEKSGFDGYYTYFASTNFTYGSSPSNWKHLQNWALTHGKIFIPCVGPGYIDTRIRPWNVSTLRDRENGEYYDRMFQEAINSNASCFGITSFNEWHEGTQIEPAIPFNIPGFKYLDYSPLAPDYYLKRTSYWVGKIKNTSKQQPPKWKK